MPRADERGERTALSRGVDRLDLDLELRLPEECFFSSYQDAALNRGDSIAGSHVWAFSVLANLACVSRKGCPGGGAWFNGGIYPTGRHPTWREKMRHQAPTLALLDLPLRERVQRI